MSITWNENWILPYESTWSILEKVKFANQVSTKQLIQIFGTEDSKKNRIGKVGKRFRNLQTMEGLDVTVLEQVLGINILEQSKKALEEIDSLLPRSIKSKELIDENLVFCVHCIKQGYHSILHQLNIINMCPIHLSNLERSCMNCKLQIPYQLAPHEYEIGFVCNCGESLILDYKGSSQFIDSWTNEQTITDRIISPWLNCFSTSKRQRIAKSIVQKDLFNSNNNVIEHLISTMEESNKKTYLVQKSPKRSEKNLYDEIYNTARNILISFEKNLQRTYLSDHRHCIKRFSGLFKRREDNQFPEICPFAYAYIFWRESFYNINPFYNDSAPLRKKNLKNLELPFYKNNDSVTETLNTIISTSTVSVRTLNWMISHMVWNVADSHFKEWLKIAVEYAPKSIRPVTKYDFSAANNSLYSFIVNEYNSNIEYHFTKNPKTIKFSKHEIFCPYQESNSKYIHEDEISHLPMRLAIQSGLESEKKVTEKYLAGLKVFSIVK